MRAFRRCIPRHPTFSRRMRPAGRRDRLAWLRHESSASHSAAATVPRERARPQGKGAGVHLHLPVRRACAARQLRPEARRPGRDPRRVPADRHRDARHLDLRAPAAAGRAAALGAGAVADTSVQRPHRSATIFMLTGRSAGAAGFRRPASRGRPTGRRSPRSRATRTRRGAINLPPAVVLPERLVHWSGGVIPVPTRAMRPPHATRCSSRRRPTATRSARGLSRVHVPQRDQEAAGVADQRTFPAPNLTLPEGLALRPAARARRACWVTSTGNGEAWKRRPRQRRFDRHRQSAISLLADAKVRRRLRRDEGRRLDPGALRPQLVRLVAADGVPAGRGGRQAWCRSTSATTRPGTRTATPSRG